MGHGKLRRFAENETFSCLLQPRPHEVLCPRDASGGLCLRDHPLKGNWGGSVFGRQAPLVLELGCGGGEYTLALAARHPEWNCVGVDIKGARLWKGARRVGQLGLSNAAFLRTRIQFIEAFFGPGEVGGIWLPFSDPQLHGSENSRLTSPWFLSRYRRFLREDGVVRLKTDSRFLYEYTRAVARANGLEVVADCPDLYGSHAPSAVEPEALEVKTFYEQMFLAQGKTVKFLAFRLRDGAFQSPGAAFDKAYWLTREKTS